MSNSSKVDIKCQVLVEAAAGNRTPYTKVTILMRPQVCGFREYTIARLSVSSVAKARVCDT